jgi:acetyl esterase
MNTSISAWEDEHGVIGKTYLERGDPVVVLAHWGGKGPRNVLIRRADGLRVVRPFRGLRLPPSCRFGGRDVDTRKDI